MAKNTRRRNKKKTTPKSEDKSQLSSTEKITDKEPKNEEPLSQKVIPLSYITVLSTTVEVPDKIEKPQQKTIIKSKAEEKYISPFNFEINNKLLRNEYIFWVQIHQDEIYELFEKFIDSEELFNDFCQHAYFTRSSNRSLLNRGILNNPYTLLNQINEYAFDKEFDFFTSTNIPDTVSDKYREFLFQPEEFVEYEQAWISV